MRSLLCMRVISDNAWPGGVPRGAYIRGIRVAKLVFDIAML
jgi:hypothetical protein